MYVQAWLDLAAEMSEMTTSQVLLFATGYQGPGRKGHEAFAWLSWAWSDDHHRKTSRVGLLSA